MTLNDIIKKYGSGDLRRNPHLNVERLPQKLEDLDYTAIAGTPGIGHISVAGIAVALARYATDLEHRLEAIKAMCP